jgi:hypothetical protein
MVDLLGESENLLQSTDFQKRVNFGVAYCRALAYDQSVLGSCKAFLAAIAFRLSFHLPFSRPNQQFIFM